MSTRHSIIARLHDLIAATPALADVRIIPTIRATDRLSKPSLIVRTNTIEKLLEAPIKQVMGTFTLVLVSPHTDLEKAEDQLDDLLDALLPALFDSKIKWTLATQTQYDDEHLAYDITIQTILS